MATRKNPAAVALGRRGGKAKGKPKGLAVLTPAERRRIARLGGLAKAAKARKRKGGKG